MPEQKLNIVIIGCGMYVCGRGTDGYGTILPAVYEWLRFKQGEVYIAGAQVKGIREIKKKALELNKLFGYKISLKYFPDGSKDNPRAYQEAIKRIPKPACAIIAVPDNLHKEVASFCIKNGLHVLVVKPLAPTVKEVKELIELQSKHKVYCAVEFHKRFDYANLKLKEVIAKGEIGQPEYFIVEYSQRKSVPLKHFKAWAATTNIFQYLGVHYVDIIYFATGAQPLRVSATGQKNYLLSSGIDAYDSIQANIEWLMPSGKKFISSIFTNWIDPENTSAMSDQKIKVIGTKGRFESDQKKRGITIVTDSKGSQEPNSYFCASYGPAGKAVYKGYGIESVCQFLDDAVNIKEGRSKKEDLEALRPTFRQSLVPTKVLAAAAESLKYNGDWVKINSIN